MEESNEVIKAKAICKQFIKEQELSLENNMTTNPDGTLVFNVTYSMSNNEEATVYFSVIPTTNKEVQDKILVWSDITTLENVPAQTKQDFFKGILELNYISDTAWCGVAKDGKISVKSERMIKGVDVDELADMVKMTAKLALEVRSKICVVYGVKTLKASELAGPTQDGTDPNQKKAYTELLGKLQRKVLETVDSCKLALHDREFQVCCKNYFKDAYELLDMIKKGAQSDPVIETIKEDLERAIADIPYYPDNQKRYEMVYEVFQKILKAR